MRKVAEEHIHLPEEYWKTSPEGSWTDSRGYWRKGERHVQLSGGVKNLAVRKLVSFYPLIISRELWLYQVNVEKLSLTTLPNVLI